MNKDSKGKTSCLLYLTALAFKSWEKTVDIMAGTSNFE